MTPFYFQLFSNPLVWLNRQVFIQGYTDYLDRNYYPPNQGPYPVGHPFFLTYLEGQEQADQDRLEF